MFFAPLAGLMRLNSGLIAVSDGRNPTWAMFAMTPTATHTPAIGPTCGRERVENRHQQVLEPGGRRDIAGVGDVGERVTHRPGDGADGGRADP